MKVLLIMPPFTQSMKAMKRCIVPLGLAYIAAVLEENGIVTKILDCMVEGYYNDVRENDNRITYGLSDSEIKERIKEYSPDFVGVSCLMSAQAHNAHRMCSLAKEVDLKIQTVMGGCHPSAFAEKMLEDVNINHVAVGEGEQSMLDIVLGRKEGVVKSAPIDINRLPMPARHLVPMEKYIKINMPTSTFSPHKRVTQIETSRGCPFKCVFCAATNFWGKWRGRDADKVLDEIQFLKTRYKIEELDILDSNLTVNRKRLVKILEGLEEIGIAWANPGGIWVGGLDTELLNLMKQSGCYQLSFAIESSTPKILSDVIKKPLKLDTVKPLVEHCQKIGIDLHAFFVSGFPEETVEEMKNDYRFAKAMNFTSASFNIVNPIPGSELYEKYPVDFSQIELRNSTIPHPEISSVELEKLIAGFNKRFNSSLIYRNPRMFFKKYVETALRKKSFGFVARMFGRQ